MKITKKVQIWISAVALLCVTFIGGTVIAKTSHTSAKLEAPIFAPAVKNAAMAVPLAGSYAPLIKEALPEVVNIASSRMVRRSDEESNPMFDDPLFRQFFGDKGPARESRNRRRSKAWAPA